MDVIIKDNHNDEFEMAQIGLVTYLRLMATRFYDDAYQPYPEFTENLIFKNIRELSPHMGKRVNSQANEWLLNKHIIEYAPYKSGHSAVALVGRTDTGRFCTIRIPIGFSDPESHNRIDHPAELQPFPNGVFPHKNDTNIEILPFVPTIGEDDMNFGGKDESLMSRLHILTAMHAITGLYSRDGVKNDLGILPDGTPVSVDPDSLKFITDAPLSREEVERQHEKMLRTHPYVLPIAWIKDGKPKQEFFFGDDYLSTPLPLKPGLPKIAPEALVAR